MRITREKGEGRQEREEEGKDSGNTGMRLRRSVIYGGINLIHCFTQHSTQQAFNLFLF